MDTKASSNAVGFIRIGLAALLFSVLYPACRLFEGSAAAGTDASTVIFRGGLFFVVLGVAVRHGWLAAASATGGSQGATAGSAPHGG